MRIVINVDGGSRGNPGPAAAGVVIARDDGQLLHEAGYFLGHDTNNGAEYKALILALRRVESMSLSHVAIRSDSELLVRQITGDYRVKSPTLAKLYEQAQLLLLRIPRWQIQHVRREENRRADWLANQALDHQRDVIIFDIDDENGGAKSKSPPADSDEKPAILEPAPRAAAADQQSESTESQHSSVAATTDPRIVTVSVSRRPADGACPVNACAGDGFAVDAALPAGLCVYAANALLPTILAMRGTPAGDFANVPAMTIRCGNPNCGAQFTVAPAIHKNGKLK
ncbi:MAG: reverse transcriptase-like protein [Phycisphaerales bacterium]|nr:reverse transcriptase-like protein [Phycisphaerales bacterium]